ncbi:Uncharacterised protein [BD1-7 clade bacterium]|uniref:Peptidase C39-like domain-containing protein n=1 Tax=BD1-7 clade bacterium TaxID=2029982 RepID=A0A5S9N5Q8_9GAMM|nr:Uncharacterised protein [BD1-7 clade bacterium]CAA0084620.1 Uncharacterised protein [BD1-7 clade bacterium]
MAEGFAPLSQGDLDSLCGIYAIVNVVNYLTGPHSEKKNVGLFSGLIEEFSRHWDLLSLLSSGTSCQQLSWLLRKSVINQYDLHLSRPFYHHPNVDIDTVWSAAKEWVDNGGVIIWGDEYHWTVVVRMTTRTAFFADSYGQQLVRKTRFETKSRTLLPTSLYFIKK